MRRPIPKKIRDEVKLRFCGRCGYCGHKPNRLVIDHIVPVEAGGGDDVSNLMPACSSCNNYKNVFSVEQFRREVAESIRKARSYSVNFRFAERFGLVQVCERPIKFYFEEAKP